MNTEHDDTLHEILSAICDETATAEQLEWLTARLRTDAVARRFYVRYLDMHARLTALPALAAVTADMNDAEHRPDRWRAAAWGGAAAVVVMAAVLIGGLARRAATPDAPTQADAAISPYVATIIDAAPESQLGDQPITVGGRLSTGRFHLIRGPCTLRFDGGAQLLFGNEARFEIVSRNAIRIHEAAFTFRGDVTCESISITTPRSTLVDVGTEYTALVTPGSEDIHVVDGMVRRTASGGDAATDLLPAKTGRSYAGRAAVGRTIEFNPAPAAAGPQLAAHRPRIRLPPLAWDRFDTDARWIGGVGGGSGWKAAWISHDGLPEYAILRPGLGGPGSGAIVHTGAGCAAAHRNLASPIDLGTDGVWYVRYLVRRPATREKDPNLAMLVLRTWGLTTEEEIQRQSALQLAVCQADTLALKFNGQSVRSAVPQSPGETFAVVAKIVAGRVGPDQIFASAFPAGQLGAREPLDWAAATDCVSAAHVYDQVSVEVVSQEEVCVGDIAIGTTWSSIATGANAAP